MAIYGFRVGIRSRTEGAADFDRHPTEPWNKVDEPTLHEVGYWHHCWTGLGDSSNKPLPPMIKHLTPALLMLTLLVSSCRTAYDHLLSGDYVRAYSQSIRQLDRGNNKNNNKSVLERATKAILSSSDSVKTRLLQRDDYVSLGNALKINQEQLIICEEVARHLGSNYSHRHEVLQREEKKLQSQLANAHFREGKRALDDYVWTGEKPRAQVAYKHFVSAKELGIRGRDIEGLQRRSQKAGLVRYTFELSSSPGANYDFEMRSRFNDLAGKPSLFKVVNVIHQPVQKLVADCHITLDFDRIYSYERPATSHTTSYTEDIVVGHEVVTDSLGQTKIIPIYEEVCGSIETIELENNYSLELDVGVFSATNQCELREASFSAAVTQTTTQVRLRGDVRAIPPHLQHSAPLFQDDEDDAIEDLIEELYCDVKAHYLR